MTSKEYRGLVGEVVTHDCYHLEWINFVPDIVFDIGANVGVFTQLARIHYPNARIIAVEPHPGNVEEFKKNALDHNVVLIERAIGVGPVYFHAGANGAMVNYRSPCTGYDWKELDSAEDWKPVDHIPSITFGEVVTQYARPGLKTVVKIDCEGGETSIFEDALSMAALAGMDVVTMELHYFSHTGAGIEPVRKLTESALDRLSETHKITREGIYVYARRKS